MPRFHINKDEQVRPCKAKTKCPFGEEEEHYSNKKEALQSLERIIEMEVSISEKKPQKRNAQLVKALSSKLKYSGEKPEWFKPIEDESLKRFGKPSEIIDEIEIEGKPTLVVWHDDSLRNKDIGPQKAGYNVSRLVYLDKETGDERAYLNVTYSSDESSERAFKNDELTSLRQLAENDSRFYAYRKDENLIKLRKLEGDEEGSEETYEEKAKLWKKAVFSLQVDFGREPKRSYTFSDEDLPSNEKELDKDIEKIIEATKESYDNYRLSSKTPKIDFSRVSDDLRGKGLGVSMYIYAAKKLAEKDLVLASSTMQSDHAIKAWKRMGQDTKIPMKVIVTKFVKNGYSQNAERFAIDFRKSKVKK